MDNPNTMASRKLIQLSLPMTAIPGSNLIERYFTNREDGTKSRMVKSRHLLKLEQWAPPVKIAEKERKA